MMPSFQHRPARPIALVASAGGHFTELMKAVDPVLWDNSFCVTTSSVLKTALPDKRVYSVVECNRQHPIRLLILFFQCVRILVRERPSAIFSTGAAVGCVMCLLAKVTGAQVVWLDSITNVDRPSLSGRLVRPFADLFLVQWPDLAKAWGAEYRGAVI